MDLRTVDNLLDFTVFRHNFNNLTRMQVSSEYMRKCKLFGWYNEQGRLEGGYAFAQGEAMAWPKLIDASKLSKVSIPETLEFNLAWASSSLRSNRLSMIRYWLASVKIIRSFRDVKNISFAVDANASGLVRLYSRFGAIKIYEGGVEKYPEKKVIIYLLSKKKFSLLPLIYSKEILSRLWTYVARKLSSMSDASDKLVTDAK